MSETREQVQLRLHMAEMRRAVHGLGKDFALEFSQIDVKIARLGSLTTKEAKYALLDIEDDFAHLGGAIDAEMRRLPGQVAAGFVAAGRGISSGTARVAGATAAALESAGHRAKEGTRNALAAAAGVKRTPMKQWRAPGSEDPPSNDEP